MHVDSNCLAGLPAGTESRPHVRRGALERMPKWLICIPLVLQWLWLGMRYRSLTLPSAANPNLTAGGLVGEGKLEYFESMGPAARAASARYTSITNTRRVPDAQLAAALARAQLAYPIIAKPDLGLCGFGVQRIDHAGALRAYLARYPVGEVVLLQEYLPQAHEAGIFYARAPGAERGQIIGLALRYFPRVTGNGQLTLGRLIDADPRARRALASQAHSFCDDPARVPAAGEVVRLATIGSTRVGGLYRNGQALITERLSAAIDAIAADMPGFHFGRFDLRFRSADELCEGRGFTIMDVNGAGSEANQAWDPDIGLFEGFGIIFDQQRLLFRIGAANRARGVKPIGLVRLARLNRRQNRLIGRYPPSN